MSTETFPTPVIPFNSGVTSVPVEPDPRDLRRAQEHRKSVILGSIIIISILVIAVVSIVYVLMNLKNQDKNPTQPEVEVRNAGLKIRDSRLLYLQDGSLYKMDLANQTKSKLEIPGVSNIFEGSSSQTFGQTDPVLSPDGNKLAFIDADSIKVYDLESGKLVVDSLPNPTKGKRELWIHSFSPDSKKLLLTVTCVQKNDSESNYVDCDQNFKDKSSGLYAFDIANESNTKVKDTAKYLNNKYYSLIGWAPYTNNKILVSLEVRDFIPGPIKELQVLEFDALGEDVKVVKKLAATSTDGKVLKWLVFNASDFQKYMLYSTSDTNSWNVYHTKESASTNTDLAFNASLIKHVEGFASMPSISFMNNDSNQVLIKTKLEKNQNILILDITGKVILDKTIEASSNDSVGIDQYGSQFFVMSSPITGVSIIRTDGWQTITKIPAIKNAAGNDVNAKVVY